MELVRSKKLVDMCVLNDNLNAPIAALFDELNMMADAEIDSKDNFPGT